MPKSVGDFFKILCSDINLHSLIEFYTCRQLVDCHRMRLQDSSNYANKKRGGYAGVNRMMEFRRFLDLAENRRELLLGWWTVEKPNVCELMAWHNTQWPSAFRCGESDCDRALSGSPYANDSRLFAEEIYGEKINMGF